VSAPRTFEAGDVPLKGTHLIEAGAGTGKTHAIVSLYLRLLLERELDVAQILVLTYTVAATAELRSRIRGRLVELVAESECAADEARAREALRGFDRAAIFTIHGFCQRVLSEHAFESGASFESELQSDPGAILEEVADDFFVRELHGVSPEIADYAAPKLTPQRLVELAKRVAPDPDIEIRPSRPERPNLIVLDADWRDAFGRTAACWKRRRAEVLDLLVDARSRRVLVPRLYTESSIRDRWGPNLDRVLTEPTLDIRKSFKYFDRLTSSGLLSHNQNGANGPPPEHEFFALCEELLDAEAALLEGQRDWLLGLEHDFVEYARGELARRKQQRGVVFFDDLLQDLRTALEGPAGPALAALVRGRHRVALIDEFQDADPVQYGIFSRIFGGDASGDANAPGLFLIGDPKQAIYAFRGADVFAYLAARDAAGSEVYGLKTNHRSDPGLVEALNTIFGACTEPFGTDAISFEPLDVPRDASDRTEGERIASGLRVLFVSRDDGKKVGAGWRAGRLAKAVAAEVDRLLSSDVQIEARPIQSRDIAVLTRTNAQAREIQGALRPHGIVSVLQSEESVFATDEAAELERVMRAMAEPDSPARLRAALATTLLASSAEDLLGLLSDSDSQLEGSDDARLEGSDWEIWTGRFRGSRKLWVSHGFIQAFRLLWLEGGAGPRLLARDDGERRVTNLLHLAELLQQAATLGRLGPLALVYWFGRRRAEAKQSGSWVAEDAQLRLESDDLAVQLVTVHRSKGLEYPVTICPYLWEGRLIQQREPFPRFHDPATGRLALDLIKHPERESYRLARKEAFAESLRLLYVALTRAKHHCSVVWGAFGDAGTSPLGHLLHPVPLMEGDPPDAKRFEGRSDESLLSDLAALALRAPGCIAVEELDASPAGTALPPKSSGSSGSLGHPLVDSLRSRPVRRSFSGAWRVSSFSGLVSSAPERVLVGESLGLEVEEGHDFDGHAGDGRAGDARGEEPPAEPAGPRVRLADFPAGAGPGILIHGIFERLDFTRSREQSLDELVAESLAARRIGEAFSAPLSAAIRDVLATPLDPGDPGSALQTLSRSDRIDEMAFMLPVAEARAAGPVTPAKLAAVFERHATAPVVRHYAERASTLGFRALEGHLRGFIDLVFRRDGRWYVVDYKSNHLGALASDYQATALEQAMLQHDYVLQYHLYLVALHRHLSFRLPDYDYDRDVGGAYYLFVRGMSPEHSPGSGVLHDRPPRALIEELSRLFDAGREYAS
jgi:exodeoxyribonuclease V beta subunit